MSDDLKLHWSVTTVKQVSDHDANEEINKPGFDNFNSIVKCLVHFILNKLYVVMFEALAFITHTINSYNINGK